MDIIHNIKVVALTICLVFSISVGLRKAIATVSHLELAHSMSVALTLRFL